MNFHFFLIEWKICVFLSMCVVNFLLVWWSNFLCCDQKFLCGGQGDPISKSEAQIKDKIELESEFSLGFAIDNFQN
jgi:hypothetical protein